MTREEADLVLGELAHAKHLVDRACSRGYSRVNTTIDRDDLEAAAQEALVRAAGSWDPSKGPFGAWANIKMSHALQDLCREGDHLTRTQRRNSDMVGDDRAPSSLDEAAESGTVTHLDLLVADTFEDEESVFAADDHAFALRLLQVLPLREQLVICLRFFAHFTLGEVAALLGVSESRVSQIDSTALSRMRGQTTEAPTPEDEELEAEKRAAVVRHTGVVTEKEMDVLYGAARGETNEETARRRTISIETVKTQRRKVIEKLGAVNMTSAVHIAWEQGLLGEKNHESRLDSPANSG